MNINISVDIADILDELRCSMGQKELLEFIKEIDKMVANYDFTRELRDYFVEEIKREDEVDVGDIYKHCSFSDLPKSVGDTLLGRVEDEI